MAEYLLFNLSSQDNPSLDFEKIKNYIISQNIDNDKSFHQFQQALASEVSDCFCSITQCDQILEEIQVKYPGCDVYNVEKMNEIYVSSLDARGSDKVFITPHIDGPFYLFPFCTLLRGIIIIQASGNVSNVIPLEKAKFVLCEGDVYLFDYNRHPHFIQQTNPIDDKEHIDRIVLKSHYAVIPSRFRFLYKPFVKLNALYNSSARKVFLTSQNPDNFFKSLLANIVNSITKLYCTFETKIGFFNIFILLAIFSLLMVKNASIKDAIYALSFIQYIFYLCAYIFKEVALGKFIRDAKLFKTISFTALFYLYLTSPVNIASLSLVAIGMAISCLAYLKLGDDKTYFGQEFGIVPYKKIKNFPYSLLPHPMILGAIIGIGGTLINNDFAKDWAWLAIIHIICYLAVLLAEITQFTLPKENKFDQLFEDFSKFHQKPKNVFAHLITFSAGFLATLGLVEFLTVACLDLPEFVPGLIVISFGIFLFYTTSNNVALASCLLLLAIFVIFTLYPISFVFHIVILVLAVVLQELSHIIFDEKTFLSSYWKDSNALLILTLHTIFLPAFLVKSLFFRSLSKSFSS